MCFLQLRDELEKGEKESAELQEFANAILQQIADHCPDILEQVVNALEESSWPRPLAPLEQHTSGQAQSVQGAMRGGWKTENGIETSGAPFTRKTKEKKKNKNTNKL